MLGYKNPIWVMGNPPGTTLTTPQGSPCHALARPGATIPSPEQDHDFSGAVRRWAAEGTPHGRSTGVRTIATSPPGTLMAKPRYYLPRNEPPPTPPNYQRASLISGHKKERCASPVAPLFLW